MNYDQEQWGRLWERAKQLEARVIVRKREAFTEICARFPVTKYKSFGALARARREGRLPENISITIDGYVQEIATLTVEANKCRQESDRLLEEHLRADIRKVLDPRVDSIPPSEYPKLRECKIYPLRRSCNHGENTISRWERCEYMKYDNSKSIFAPNRWVCTSQK